MSPSPLAPNPVRLSDAVCAQARTLIVRRLGLNFPENRQADLERGLTRAAHAASLADPEAYLARLPTLPEESPEWRRLASDLTVGETYFFYYLNNWVWFGLVLGEGPAINLWRGQP